MASNVNNNSWATWDNHFTESATLISTINESLSNLNSAPMSYQQYVNDCNQIQNALNNASNLPSSPLLTQFLTGAQNAFNQITTGPMTIYDPTTRTNVPVADLGYWEADFTINPTFTQFSENEFSGQKPFWLPGDTTVGTVNGVSETWGQAWFNAQPGQSYNFLYTLPNGDVLTLTFSLSVDDNCSIEVSGPISDFTSAITVQSVNASSMQNFMSKW